MEKNRISMICVITAIVIFFFLRKINSLDTIIPSGKVVVRIKNLSLSYFRIGEKSP